MFIFDRFHCSLAAMTPAKYESDSKDLTDTFVKSEKYIGEKLTVLVTTTRGCQQ